MKRKVSVIQQPPVFFNKEETLQKMDRIAEIESRKGSELILFPESFLPGYPRGFTFGSPVGSRTEEGRELYKSYYQNSADLSSEDGKRLEKMASDHGVFIVAGITEKTAGNGSLYCSMAYVSSKKGIVGVHRKIKPTAAERIIWAEGDGSGLITLDTDFGILGGLICWENYMPEARMAMYRKGVQIYLAPTADARESWIPTMRHIAMEGRCFVLGCNQYVEKKDIPEIYRSHLSEEPEVLSRGGSVVVSPMGEILAGPLWDEAGVLRIQIDTEDVQRAKLDLDINGHYSRPDIFSLEVKGIPDTVKV